jgi:hypothetical protein
MGDRKGRSYRKKRREQVDYGLFAIPSCLDIGKDMSCMSPVRDQDLQPATHPVKPEGRLCDL